MAAILQDYTKVSIFEEIETHPSWHGLMSGLHAEKILRDRKIPYLYLLRAGELKNDYYVTFILPDFSIKHQPFIITDSFEGWYYENAGGGGPYIEESIEDVLHLIMHCQKKDCVAFEKE
ncbi:MAG: hypothetical protein WCP39_01875 [Chlamydiota bacterium]